MLVSAFFQMGERWSSVAKDYWQETPVLVIVLVVYIKSVFIDEEGSNSYNPYT